MTTIKYTNLNHTQLWKIFSPTRKGANLIIGGDVLNQLLLNFIKYPQNRLRKSLMILTEDYKDLFNKIISNDYTINILILYYFFNNREHETFNQIKNKQIKIFFKIGKFTWTRLKYILEKSLVDSRIVFSSIPIDEFSFPTGNIDFKYQIRKNFLILKSIHEFSVKRNIYLTLLYKTKNKKLLSPLSDEHVKSLSELFNAIIYIKKTSNEAIEIIYHTKGKNKFYKIDEL